MAQFSAKNQDWMGQGTRNDIHEVVMIADKDGNILNTSGAASNIPIAAGEVSGYSHINKFGATNGDVTEGTVWDGNDGDVVYPYPDAGLVSISSSTEVGETVEVQGLDADYNLQTEVIAIGGTGALTFSRIFRAKMSTATNASDVEINQGGELAAKILAGLGQTLMAVYTVPAGKTAYILGIHLGSDKASTNSRMTYRLFTRDILNGGVFRIKANLNAAGGQSLDIEYPVPLVVPEKHDIKIDVVAGQATQVSATFDIILVDND
jgi:hypothetical protein